MRRLLAGHRTAWADGWIKWLAQVTLLLATVWTVSLLKKPVPSLSIWEFQSPALVFGWLVVAACHFVIQAIIFFMLGLLVPVVLRGRRGTAKPRRFVQQTIDVKVVGDGSVGRAGGAGQDGRLEAHPPATTGWESAPRDRLVARASRWAARLSGVGRVAGHAMLAIGLFVAVVAAAVTGSAMLVGTVGISAALDVGVALMGVSAGIWIGWWSNSGWAGARRLLVQYLAVFLFLAGGTLWLRAQVLQTQPLDLPLVAVTSADKRALVEAVKQHSETREGHRVLRVTADQIDKLCAWWVAFALPESRAKVELSDKGQRVWAALRLSQRPTGTRSYLNLFVDGRCEVADQRLELDVRRVQIGAVTIPAWLVRLASDCLVQWLNDDPVNRDLLLGVSAAITHKGGAELYLTEDGIRQRRWAKALREIHDYPDLSQVVAQHLDEFSELVRQADRREPLFGPVVRKAFQTAAARSVSGDPVKANRAAILALGIVLGQSTLEKYVNDQWEGVALGTLARVPGRSRLRGRPDWSRHFWVSAAVTLITSNRVSDALGQLKEELDAGQGGSGFSFGDLAADRAGTTFAQAATRDDQSAVAVQQWILNPDTNLDQLMPIAADLPEGMSDADMEEHFDAVGGARYQQMIAEIDRRIKALPWGK